MFCNDERKMCEKGALALHKGAQKVRKCKSAIFIWHFLLFVSNVFVTFDGKKQSSMLMKKLIYNPLLAVIVLACVPSTRYSGMDGQEARTIMDDVSRRNLAYETLTAHDDTMMQQVVKYYEKHGTANERMEAYYLWGSVLRDQQEAPRAMEAFHFGISAADTTSAECRYGLLARLYGQIADILYRQRLRRLTAEAERMVYKYAVLAEDTLLMVASRWEQFGEWFAYKDFAAVADSCWGLLKESERLGMYPYAAKHLCTSIQANLEVGRTEDAARLLDIFERHSGLVDPETHECSFPIYYYAKGRVLSAFGKYDSAEHFFRKELAAEDWNNRQAACRGLRELFGKLGMKDSALKYAALQCEAVDSDYQTMIADNLQNLHEQYNYNRLLKDNYQKERQLENERRKMQYVWWGTAVCAVVAVMALYFLRLRYKKKIIESELEQERFSAEQTEMMLYVAELQDRLRRSESEQERKEITEELSTVEGNGYEAGALAKRLRQTYFQSDTFQRMLMLMNDGKVPTEEDYAEIQSLLQKHDKSLMMRLCNAAAISDMERRIFLLRRMGMKKSEIALLTCRAKSSIVSTIKRLFEKSHTHKPTCCAEADEWLLRL